MLSISLALLSAAALTACAAADPEQRPAAAGSPHPQHNARLAALPRQFKEFKVTGNMASSKVGKVIPVMVGGSALAYTPNSVTANPGDIVQFQFNARNHTVTQSDPTVPCQPMAGPAAGVNSGFIPFDTASGMVGTFDMPVTNSGPMFFYCATGPHCQSGMVMAVNASPDKLIEYAQLAANQKDNIPAPSIVGGTQANIPIANAVFGTPPAVSSGAAASTPAQSAPPSSPQPTPPSNGTMSNGTVAVPPGVSVLPDGSIPPTITILTTFTPTVTAGADGQPATRTPSSADSASKEQQQQQQDKGQGIVKNTGSVLHEPGGLLAVCLLGMGLTMLGGWLI